MWGKILVSLCYVSVQVASHQINVTCTTTRDFPTTNEACPSKVEDVDVKEVMEENTVNLNISWAINIDASVDYLTGTRIGITGEPSYLCTYSPPFAKANLTGSKKEWFHFIVSASDGFIVVNVCNVPWPPQGGGDQSIYRYLHVSSPKRATVTTTSHVTKDVSFTFENTKKPPASVEASSEPSTTVQRFNNAIIIVVGALAAMMILGSFCVMRKFCLPVLDSYSGVKNLSVSPVVPVSVLVVYPSENSAFQRAVVALAEFLQLHGDCNVAIDLWQQGKVAELGPLRWLAEQTKAADHVLIVSPQGETLSSVSHSAPKLNLPEHPIPAAAHDLYPLILNMVATRAKSASGLAKFSVVHLNKKSCVFLPELIACKSFYLIKDLNKLCKSLHDQRKVGKYVPSLLLRPGISHSKNKTVKLRKALEMLGGVDPSASRELLIEGL